MRFTVKAKELVAPLEIAAAAASDVARLHVDGDGVSVVAQVPIQDAFVEVSVCGEAIGRERGTTSVPTLPLLKIAKARKKGETLEVLSDEEGRLVVRTAGPIYQLVADKEGTEARSPNHAHGAVIPGFAEAWRFIRHAILKDGTRPHLAGPAVDLRNGRLFATDGRRAAIAQVDGTLDVDPVVVHWGLVAVIDKVIKHVSEARFETSCVHVLRFPGVSVWWCSRRDVRPPPIDKVIPDSAAAKRVVRFDALTALAAIKGVTLLAPPREEIPLRVRLGSAKGTLEYKNDGSTTTCAMPIAGEGDAVSFLVQTHYLSEALVAFGDGEVSFRVSGPKEAMVITQGDFLTLIMPMKE